MNEKLQRINKMVEGLLGLSLLGSAYNYNTGSSANYNYQSLSGNTSSSSLDMSSFGINEPTIDLSDPEQDIEGVESTDTFLRFNSSPSMGGSIGSQNISGMNKNFLTDEEMIEELKDAVYEGLGNYEEENNDDVDIDTLKVSQEDIGSDDTDVFNIVVVLEEEYNIDKGQQLIDYVIPVIETLDTGNISVTGVFDYDSRDEEEIDPDEDDDLEDDEEDDGIELDTEEEEIEDEEIEDLDDEDLEEDSSIDIETSPIKNKYKPILRFKVVVSR